MNIFKWIKSSDERVEAALRQSTGYNASPDEQAISTSLRWDAVVQGAANEKPSSLELWDNYTYEGGHCITLKNQKQA